MSSNVLPEPLQKLFDHIDANKTQYIEALREAVAIKSVSAWPAYRPDLSKMVHWTADKLKELGASVELVDVGFETIHNGCPLPLPEIILGSLGNDSAKKTVCVYGHLDVQPALKNDGWDTEPFELTEKDGKLFGRGSTDDKGPVLCWLHAIASFQGAAIELPVNIRFVFEGMEESASEGLTDLLKSRKDTFLSDVDYVCVSDNYWLGNDKPCLTYGLRGICYFYVEIECATRDLHSGVYGGVVNEAMSDIIYILDTLIDKEGHMLIANIYDDVAPLDENEHELYDHISFDVNQYQKDTGVTSLLHNGDKTQLLMHRWRYPSLSIHGIEGAYFQPGNKAVIPHKVIGKFSLRIVPNQTPEKVYQLVCDHINAKWAERESTNKIKISLADGCKAFVEDPNHPHYEAAKKATRHVYKIEPDMIRSGGSVNPALTLSDITDKCVVLLPIGADDDGAHSQNEKLDVRNYIEGTKLLGAYLYEVAQLKE